MYKRRTGTLAFLIGSMRQNKPPKLASQIALQIHEMIREGRFETGEHLIAQKLADEFRVSRQPVKIALKILEDHGVVESRPNRGCFVLGSDSGNDDRIVEELGGREEEPYFQVAEDRLTGRLPDEVTETDLRRHYGVSRAELQTMLSRMAQEGWIERKPGYGWRFLPVLTSPAVHLQSYEFRLVIEPAAMSYPVYEVDQEALAQCRELQVAMLEGEIWKMSPSRLFQVGSELHEMLAGFAGNPFFLDSLKRINRLRRLIEYRSMLDRGRLIQQCEEHIHLLDLVAEGKREEATDFLRVHLGDVRDRKSRFFQSNGALRGVQPSF